MNKISELKSFVEKQETIYVDLFDTICHRKYSTEYVFYQYTDFLIQNYKINSDFFGLFHTLQTIFTNIWGDEKTTFERVYYHYNLDKDFDFDTFYKKSISIFVKYESKNIEIDESVLSVLKQSSKKVSVLSDFYLSFDTVNQIFNNVVPNFFSTFNRVYISADYKKTKYDGTFFSFINGTDNSAKKCMIDDNLGNIKNARKEGFETFHIDSKEYYAKYKKYDDNYLKTINKTILDSTWIKKHKYYISNFTYFVFDYCKRLYQEIENGDCIYFMSREGLLLKDYFDHYLSVHTEKTANTFWLPISRFSSLFLDEGILNVSFNVFMKQIYDNVAEKITSTNQLLSYFSFKQSEIEKCINECSKKHKITIENNTLPLEYFGKVYDLSLFKETLRNNIVSARLKLIKLLGNNSKNRIVVTDVGWKGSFQNRISKLLPETNIFGYYLALTANEGENSKCHKKGLILDLTNDAFFNRRLESIALLEVLLRPNVGRHSFYNLDEDIFVRDNSIDVHFNYSKERNNLTMESFKKLVNIDSITPIDKDILHSLEYRFLKKYRLRWTQYDYYYSNLTTQNVDFKPLGLKERIIIEKDITKKRIIKLIPSSLLTTIFELLYGKNK